MTPEIDEKLAALIDKLTAEIRDSIDATKLQLLAGAVEAACDGLQPCDAGELRMAAAVLVLEQLGASAKAISLAKSKILGGPQPASIRNH